MDKEIIDGMRHGNVFDLGKKWYSKACKETAKKQKWGNQTRFHRLSKNVGDAHKINANIYRFSGWTIGEKTILVACVVKKGSINGERAAVFARKFIVPYDTGIMWLSEQVRTKILRSCILAENANTALRAVGVRHRAILVVATFLITLEFKRALRNNRWFISMPLVGNVDAES